MAEPGVWKLGAYALCVRDDALLLARMSPTFPDAGSWTLPGGGVEFGEHPDDAVLRELREETGLVGRLGPVVAVYSRTYERSASRPYRPVHHVGLIYEVDVDDVALVNEVGGSTDQCRWLTAAEVEVEPLVELAAFAVAHRSAT